MSAPIEHVLFDADGVLQYLPSGWVDTMAPYLGPRRAEAFIRDTWHDDRAGLRGESDFLARAAQELTEGGLATTVEQLVPAIWFTIGAIPETVALARRLQAAGYGVHLGSNQERHRAAFMRSTLGYDEVFDVSVYSCDVGHAKPEPAYFTRAAELIGADPATILFVDDVEANVHGAREAGLHAEQWQADLSVADRDLPRLVKLMAEHGISLDG